MSGVTRIGQVQWSREDMTGKLEEFSWLYHERPIKDNTGGMLSAHMFLIWFALQALKPRVIVESGIWLGQGTWFFERACPNAQLYCIDRNLDRIQYRSNRAKYFKRDFSTIDWSHLPKGETVLFFDDHQNALERVKTAKRFGFKHLIFEDNYPPLQGDCYSLKKAFMHSGFKHGIPANEVDAKYLKQSLEVYYEFPPIFKAERTRWGDLWDDENYPTPEPLLNSVEREYQQLYVDEAVYYTWMCYVKLINHARRA